jgi:hypothetical protein
MSETPDQYIERILSSVADAEPWDVLASTPARLRRLTSGRTAADLERKPSPDRWSVRQIVAHLADAELVTSWRLRTILTSNGTTLHPYDQNTFATVLKYDDVPVADSLDLFEANRTANLRLLRRVDPALHQNFGMHEERGRESIAHLIRLNAGHDLNHVRQVEGLLRAT